MKLEIATEAKEIVRYLFENLYGKKPNLIVYLLEVIGIALATTLIAGMLILRRDFFNYDLAGYSPFRYTLFCILGVNGWFFFFHAHIWKFDEKDNLEIPMLHIQAMELNLIAPVIIVFIYFVEVLWKDMIL